MCCQHVQGSLWSRFSCTGPWSGLPEGGGSGLSTSNILSTSPTLMSSTSRLSYGTCCWPDWLLPSLHPWLGLFSLSWGAIRSNGSCTTTGTAWFLVLPFPTTCLSTLLFGAAACAIASVVLSTEGEGIELTAEITLCLHFSMASVKAVCLGGMRVTYLLFLGLLTVVYYFNYTLGCLFLLRCC